MPMIWTRPTSRGCAQRDSAVIVWPCVTSLLLIVIAWRAAAPVRAFALSLPSCQTSRLATRTPYDTKSSSSCNRAASLAFSSMMSSSNGKVVEISDDFCGGNIQYVDTTIDGVTSSSEVVHLKIKPDVYCEHDRKEHFQYFCFRAAAAAAASTIESNEADHNVKFVIDNAGEASYPQAWIGSTVFYTTDVDDPDSWLRNLDTLYENGQLSWSQTFTATSNVYYFAYFPPYSHARHLSLITKCQAVEALSTSSLLRVKVLGQTLEGRDVHCVTVGSGATVAWIIHRQHPGETMAEYYAEGLLTRLLRLNDGDEHGLDSDADTDIDVALDSVLSLYTIHIVPCMCIDGSVRGHLRTNSIGANLNREWGDSTTTSGYSAPTMERSPEVHAVWNTMQTTGVDLFLDVHGDEDLPFNFLSGAEKTTHWGPRLQALHGAFLAAYQRSNRDMQQPVGYAPPDDESGAWPNVATNAVSNRFNCLAATLEMPFKDCLSNSDPTRGWSPDRSRQLGASVLEAMVYIHPFLRDTTDFWTQLSAEDAYVTPSPKYDAKDYANRK